MKLWTDRWWPEVKEVEMSRAIFNDPTHPTRKLYDGFLYREKDEALLARSRRAAKKIASLKKQIAKLEAML